MIKIPARKNIILLVINLYWKGFCLEMLYIILMIDFFGIKYCLIL